MVLVRRYDKDALLYDLDLDAPTGLTCQTDSDDTLAHGKDLLVVTSDDCIHINERLRLYDKLRELRSYHLFVIIRVKNDIQFDTWSS